MWVSYKMKITYEGQSYEITNWDEFKDKLMDSIGTEVVRAIQKDIIKKKIWDKGAYKRGVKYYIDSDGNLNVFNEMKYAHFIEYGTAGARRGVNDPFNEKTRGPKPSRKMPYDKKSFGKGKEPKLVEGLDEWANIHGFRTKGAKFNLARHIRDYGMEAFAPFRSILYNPQEMAKVINKAMKRTTL